MAKKNHRDLTDPNLHEPKGVSGASEGEVYVADGAASGNWVAKGPLYAEALDTAPEGNNSGGSTANAWTATILDDENDDAGLYTLTSNQITFTAAGTYLLRGKRLIQTNQKLRLRFRNMTQATEHGLSLNISIDNYGSWTVSHVCEVVVVVTVAASDVFELQYYQSNTGTFGYHDRLSAGDEVFSEVEIMKLK
jgi:hypothetical protein